MNEKQLTPISLSCNKDDEELGKLAGAQSVMEEMLGIKTTKSKQTYIQPEPDTSDEMPDAYVSRNAEINAAPPVETEENPFKDVLASFPMVEKEIANARVDAFLLNNLWDRMKHGNTNNDTFIFLRQLVVARMFDFNMPRSTALQASCRKLGHALMQTVHYNAESIKPIEELIGLVSTFYFNDAVDCPEIHAVSDGREMQATLTKLLDVTKQPSQHANRPAPKPEQSPLKDLPPAINLYATYNAKAYHGLIGNLVIDYLCYARYIFQCIEQDMHTGVIDIPAPHTHHTVVDQINTVYLLLTHLQKIGQLDSIFTASSVKKLNDIISEMHHMHQQSVSDYDDYNNSKLDSKTYRDHMYNAVKTMITMIQQDIIYQSPWGNTPAFKFMEDKAMQWGFDLCYQNFKSRQSEILAVLKFINECPERSLRKLLVCKKDITLDDQKISKAVKLVLINVAITSAVFDQALSDKDAKVREIIQILYKLVRPVRNLELVFEEDKEFMFNLRMEYRMLLAKATHYLVWDINDNFILDQIKDKVFEDLRKAVFNFAAYVNELLMPYVDKDDRAYNSNEFAQLTPDELLRYQIVIYERMKSVVRGDGLSIRQAWIMEYVTSILSAVAMWLEYDMREGEGIIIAKPLAGCLEDAVSILTHIRANQDCGISFDSDIIMQIEDIQSKLIDCLYSENSNGNFGNEKDAICEKLSDIVDELNAPNIDIRYSVLIYNNKLLAINNLTTRAADDKTPVLDALSKLTDSCHKAKDNATYLINGGISEDLKDTYSISQINETF